MDITMINFVFPFSKPMPPLGVISLCKSLKNHHIDVEFLDYQLCKKQKPKEINTIVEFLSEVKSDIIGISCQSYQLPWLLAALKKFKHHSPQVKIILGGIGPSISAKNIMETFLFIDFILCGEGEKTLPDLVKMILSGQSEYGEIDGLCWRRNGCVSYNKKVERINCLDVLPEYDCSFIDLDAYYLVNLASSRGCTYKCSFCSLGEYWDYSLTTMSIKQFVNQIERLYVDRGIRRYAFIDDTFVLNPRRAEAICEEIIRRRMDIEWACYGRLNHMDDELMQAMSKAGCKKVFYGFESASQQVLNSMNKKTQVETAIDIVKRSKRYFDYVLTSFVWGTPGESFQEFMDSFYTVMYLASIDVAVEFNQYIPYPNSPITLQNLDSLKFDPDYSPSLLGQYYDTIQKAVITEQTPDEVIELINEYPLIFSSFCYIDTDEFIQKHSLVAGAGLTPNAINSAWEGSFLM